MLGPDTHGQLVGRLSRRMSIRIHPTAIIEENVAIGDGTSIWDNVHIRHDARIGINCIVGEKSHISYGVTIGNLVKINAFVYICTAVTIEDGVMISAGCTFTNDRYPRAADPELTMLRTSEPDRHTLPAVVCAGATIGAGCIIGPGLTVGRFAMIGMGCLVTQSVPDFALMIGRPAHCVGYVCYCGEPVIRFQLGEEPSESQAICQACGRQYELRGSQLIQSLTDFAQARAL
jgi:UDP-2-acetamido-3-amino-2,3-dideoxy-glucuronate N-acetyltransferase